MKYNVFETINNPESFKLFLKTILNLPEDVDFSLEVTDTKIIILSTNNKFAEELHDRLQSSNIRTNLKYTVQATQSNSITHQINSSYPTPISLQHNIGKLIFEKLFSGPDAEAIGQPNFQQDTNFIASAPIKKGINPALFALQIQEYRKALAKADFDQLRNAIAQHNSSSLPLMLLEDKKGPLAPHVNKIIYLDEKSNAICFNYGFLLNCLTPPELTSSEQNESNKINIMLDKQHLLSYISTVIPEGFVFQSYCNNNNQITPICFDAATTQKPAIRLTMVLDCSDSMADVFSTYIARLKSFITVLLHEDNSLFMDKDTTTIRFAPFATKPLPVGTFKLSEQIKINNFLSTLKIAGNTLLFDTVNRELETLKKMSQQDIANVMDVAIVFTDGDDTSSESKQFIKQDQVRIFTMGLQNYDRQKLTNFAEKSGGEHIHLDSMSDFNKILAYIKSFSVAHRVYQFVQEALEFTVRVPQGAVVVANNSLNSTIPFKVDDVTYQAHLQEINNNNTNNNNNNQETHNAAEVIEEKTGEESEQEPKMEASVIEDSEYDRPSHMESLMAFFTEAYQGFGSMAFSYFEPILDDILSNQETSEDDFQNSNPGPSLQH